MCSFWDGRFRCHGIGRVRAFLRRGPAAKGSAPPAQSLEPKLPQHTPYLDSQRVIIKLTGIHRTIAKNVNVH